MQRVETILQKYLKKMGASDLSYGNLTALYCNEAQKLLLVCSRVDSAAKMIVGGSRLFRCRYFSGLSRKGFSHGQSYRNGTKGKFVQFESILSLTGGKADSRYTIPTGSELSVLLLLVKALLKQPEVGDLKQFTALRRKLLDKMNWRSRLF